MGNSEKNNFENINVYLKKYYPISENLVLNYPAIVDVYHLSMFSHFVNFLYDLKKISSSLFDIELQDLNNAKLIVEKYQKNIIAESKEIFNGYIVQFSGKKVSEILAFFNYDLTIVALDKKIKESAKNNLFINKN